jgi:hypothetical protein
MVLERTKLRENLAERTAEVSRKVKDVEVAEKRVDILHKENELLGNLFSF